MAGSREPVFLARQTYRRRRLIDAMRFTAVLGLVLFMAPLLGGGAIVRSTATGGLYVFVAWLMLIAVAGGLVRLLARAPGGVASDPLDPEPTPPPSVAPDRPEAGAR